MVPGYLLARLALDLSVQGKGFGAELLADALDEVIRAAIHGGGRLVIVDAINEKAAEFYRNYGFSPVGNGARLYMKISQLIASRGQ